MKVLNEFYRFKLLEIEALEGTRQYVKHPGAVTVIALDNDGNILLERNFRCAVDREIIELPSGLKEDKDKDGLYRAQIELLEETGYIANEWKYLFSYYNSPGITDEKTDVYLARDLTLKKTNREASELLTIKEVYFERPEVLEEQILSGEIITGSEVPMAVFGYNKLVRRK